MNVVRQTYNAILMMILLTVLTGIIYPFVMTGLSHLLFPAQANGSLIKDNNGNVIGSSLVGQDFTSPGYFHPRPSAAGNGYDATSSSGSNLGPTNQTLINDVSDRASAYREENGLAPDALVPVDAVTTSGSGLDPDISPANAALQVARVAKARGISEDQVRTLVAQNTKGRDLGFLGEPRVNVLQLNLTLDALGTPGQ